MVLQAGTPELRHGEYHGQSIREAKDLLEVAHGGQVLGSSVFTELILDRLPEGVSVIDLGERTGGRAVFQLGAPGLRTDFPPLRLSHERPNNLLKNLTSFVGREAELAEVASLVREHAVVTLCGTGGIGKTRLALHVGMDLLEHFREGVWFVDLAPIREGHFVTGAIADALSVQEWPGHPIFDATLVFLKSRSLLLILDNCEQVLEAAAQAAEAISKSCPNVKILTTSREALRIAGEYTYRMPSLPSADDFATLTAQEAMHYGSVALFCERAQTADPRFILTDGNANTVAHICHRLDGIALAIELAAVRVRAIPLKTLADKLDQRLLVLTGGLRTALPRQQTMRALIAWSYDLLDERERKVFAALSVFRGGFTLEAVAAVCSDNGIDELDVFEIVSSLVEKSLVQGETAQDVERYRLLEATREFAHEQLDPSASEVALRRHAEYYRRIAAEGFALAQEHYSSFRNRDDIEIANYRVALQTHLRVIGDPALTAEYLWSLQLVLKYRRRYLHDLLFDDVRGLAAVPNLAPIVEARLCTTLASTFVKEDSRFAYACAQRAEGLFAAEGDELGWATAIEAICYSGLALRGAFGEMEESLRQAIEIASAANHRHRVGALLTNLAICYGDADRLDESLRVNEEIREWVDESDPNWSKSFANTGVIKLRLGDYSGAADLFQQAVSMVEDSEPWDAAIFLDNLSLGLLLDGRYNEARIALFRGMSFDKTYPSRFVSAALIDVAALLATRLGKDELAVRLAGFAQNLFKRSGARQPWDQRLFDDMLAQLRSVVDCDTFDRLWRSGFHMTREDADTLVASV